MLELIERADGTPWAILVALVCTPYGWPLAFLLGWLVRNLWEHRKGNKTMTYQENEATVPDVSKDIPQTSEQIAEDAGQFLFWFRVRHPDFPIAICVLEHQNATFSMHTPNQPKDVLPAVAQCLVELLKIVEPEYLKAAWAPLLRVCEAISRAACVDPE